MAVRLRLTRVGGKKDPVWRIVATDQRSPRDGRNIEILGQYNPQTEPSTINLDEEKVRGWLAKGSGTNVQAVNQLVKQFGQMRKVMKQIGRGKMPDLQAMMRQAR